MAHWMCTRCGYYLQASAPPDRCPGCEQTCAFNDVTCYRPECGGEKNVDPLVVGNTLGILKRGAEPSVGPPPPRTPLLAELLRGHSLESKDELEQLSFWAISQVEILKGLKKQDRQKLRNLGRIEHYGTNIVIFTEGAEARKFYMVEEGRLSVESQICRGMRFPISIVYPGQAFGWSTLVQPHVYTATVMALSNTRLIAIERKPLLSMLEAEPSIGFTLMQNVASIVASRLRTVELALVGLLEQDR